MICKHILGCTSTVYYDIGISTSFPPTKPIIEGIGVNEDQTCEV